MKKGVLILFSIFIFMIVGIMVYSSNKVTMTNYYSPYEGKAYVISKDRYMTFDVYFLGEDSIITKEDLNTYTLYLDDYSFVLNDVHVNKIDAGKYTIARIYAKMIEFPTKEYHSKTSTLEILNPKFKLRLSYGAMSFISDGLYPLLSVSSLYGSYSYMNGSLILSGINIKFTNHYSYMKSLKIGNIAYGALSNALYDTKLDNIVDLSMVIPSYNPKRVEEEYTIGLQSNELFIPLGYKDIQMIRSGYMIITLDNIAYYLDTFDFMTNYFDFDEYKNMMKDGVITNA